MFEGASDLAGGLTMSRQFRRRLRRCRVRNRVSSARKLQGFSVLSAFK